MEKNGGKTKSPTHHQNNHNNDDDGDDKRSKKWRKGDGRLREGRETMREGNFLLFFVCLFLFLKSMICTSCE